MVKKALSIQNLAVNFIQNKNNQSFSQLINRLRPGLFHLHITMLKIRILQTKSFLKHL
jgi:hypothetical protein